MIGMKDWRHQRPTGTGRKASTLRVQGQFLSHSVSHRNQEKTSCLSLGHKVRIVPSPGLQSTKACFHFRHRPSPPVGLLTTHTRTKKESSQSFLQYFCTTGMKLPQDLGGYCFSWRIMVGGEGGARLLGAPHPWPPARPEEVQS